MKNVFKKFGELAETNLFWYEDGVYIKAAGNVGINLLNQEQKDFLDGDTVTTGPVIGKTLKKEGFR